ncbi:UNVERIFIED_CONTAM: hypothetical protein Scaly_2836000 [Sesamum calycinum]|uniref:Uncharacterized protein n=1 Tax=Sesamum calycinum TaxID=2727403 RepID=A0AAW2IR71_9LAMI
MEVFKNFTGLSNLTGPGFLGIMSVKKRNDSRKFRQLDEIIYIHGYPGYQSLSSIVEKTMHVVCYLNVSIVGEYLKDEPWVNLLCNKSKYTTQSVFPVLMNNYGTAAAAILYSVEGLYLTRVLPCGLNNPVRAKASPNKFCNSISFIVCFFLEIFFMASHIASLDKSVRFVKEVIPNNDPSEATSRKMGPNSSGYRSERRRSLRQTAAAARRLINEEGVRDEGDGGDEVDEEGEEGPPSVKVGERSEALSTLLDTVNGDLYDCRSLIDERLLGYFSLSLRVEPLGTPSRRKLEDKVERLSAENPKLKEGKMRRKFRQYLGEVEAEMRSSPHEAAIDSAVGDIPSEGTQEPKEGDTPWPLMQDSLMLPPMRTKLRRQRKTACGDEKRTCI